MTRSTSWVGLLAVLAGFLCASPAFSQGGSGLVVIPATRTVVAALPSPPSNTSKTYIVTDGNAADDCTTGSGSTLVHCAWDGAAWVALGGGGGGSGTVTGITADGGGTTTGATVTLSGDTGITTARSTDTVSIDLDDTAVTPGAYTKVDLTVDQQGRITAAASGTVDTADLAADAVDETILDETGDYTVNSITATGGVTSGQHATDGGTVTLIEGTDDGSNTLTIGVSDAGIDSDFACVLEGGAWTGNCPAISSAFDGTTLTDHAVLYTLKEFEGLSPAIQWTYYYVDSYNANADDDGPGTIAQPFESVARCKEQMENFGTRCVLENRKGLAGTQYYGKLAFRPTASVVGCVPGEEVDDDGSGTQVALVLDVDPPSNTIVFEMTSGADLDTSDSITGTATNSACALSLAGSDANAVGDRRAILDSGTATGGTTKFLLEDTGQDFTTNVVEGDYVFNTTRTSWGRITGVSATQLNVAGGITDETGDPGAMASGDTYEIRRYAAAAHVQMDGGGPTGFEDRIVSLMESRDVSRPNPIIHCNGEHPDDDDYGISGGGLFSAAGSSNPGVVGFQNVDADYCKIDGLSQHQTAKVRSLNQQIERVQNDVNQTARNVITTHNEGYVFAVGLGGSGYPYASGAGGPIAPTGSTGANTLLAVISPYAIRLNTANMTSGTTAVTLGSGGHVVLVDTDLICEGDGSYACSGFRNQSAGVYTDWNYLVNVWASCDALGTGGTNAFGNGPQTSSGAGVSYGRYYNVGKGETCERGISTYNTNSAHDIEAHDVAFWLGSTPNSHLIYDNDAVHVAATRLVVTGGREEGTDHYSIQGVEYDDAASANAAYAGAGELDLFSTNSGLFTGDPFAGASERGQCVTSECYGQSAYSWTIPISQLAVDNDCMYDFLPLPFCSISGGGAGRNYGAR